ncbi:MAG: DUF4290 domain-containing protein [Flavobacteriales bacterium]|nr:DUF4290 domain-containing protein [Flavobacteriales bacterium]
MSTPVAAPFDYNTQRPRLIIPEYGRHVQRMVEHCMGIEEREARTRSAHAIIQVIGRLSPHLRGTESMDRTLWDHLYIMSEFKLDVDGPFPKPTAEELDTKPEPVKYPKQDIKYGHYGKLVERMIAACTAKEDGPEKEAFTLLIANLMKKQFLTWNRDSVGDGVIVKDLIELSKGKLKLTPEQQLVSTDVLLHAQRQGPRNEVDLRKQRYGNQGGGGGGKKRHRNRNKKRY